MKHIVLALLAEIVFLSLWDFVFLSMFPRFDTNFFDLVKFVVAMLIYVTVFYFSIVKYSIKIEK